jgi:probable F420-dependent oxidoreductase
MTQKDFPFRFGVLARAPRTGHGWREFARRVEGLGYSTLHVPDHMSLQLAPFPALAAAAEATTRLRVGTLVVNTDFRHPTLLAREALTLDVLTGGRFELGIGCGWKLRDYTESGIPWERGSVRVDRFEEAVAVIRRMEAPERFSFEGTWYRLRDAEGGPQPVQDPLPLLIGAGGPRMLAFAARQAQIASISRSSRAGSSPAEIARDAMVSAVAAKTARLREEAGDRFGQLELHILVTLLEVGDGAREVARDFAQRHELTVEDTLDTPQHLIGSQEQIVEQLLARRERLGLTYITIWEEHVDVFAGIVAQLGAAA